MTDVPMFAAPPAPEPKLSKHLERCKLGKDEKVSYAKYRTTKHVQCIECVWVLHEAGGKGWSINGAGSVTQSTRNLSSVDGGR